MRRIAGLVALALTLAPISAVEAGTSPTCSDRILVLSAYPGEVDLLLRSMPGPDIVHAAEGRTFFLGHLGQNDVAVGLSGIGLVNAKRTTEIALDTFSCGAVKHITGIVFSGVAGGENIGDVTVPTAWTDDGTVTMFDVDPLMYAVAQSVADEVDLERAVPTGDALCVGAPPRAVTTVSVSIEPEIRFGGFGASADGFGGRAFPCIPGGGDVFGCAPCHVPGPESVPDAERFAESVIPFLDPAFFFEYFQMPGAPADAAAVDMETGAVARVAEAKAVPFIAFRGASDGDGDADGDGDVLMLPGFPFEFFFYRQLAADNAARMTLAFLGAW